MEPEAENPTPPKNEAPTPDPRARAFYAHMVMEEIERAELVDALMRARRANDYYMGVIAGLIAGAIMVGVVSLYFRED